MYFSTQLNLQNKLTEKLVSNALSDSFLRKHFAQLLRQQLEKLLIDLHIFIKKISFKRLLDFGHMFALLMKSVFGFLHTVIFHEK